MVNLNSLVRARGEGSLYIKWEGKEEGDGKGGAARELSAKFMP